MARAILRIVFIAVLFGAHTPAPLENPAPAAEPDSSEIISFTDDFQTDTRSRYFVEQPVEWRRGALTIRPGAVVSKRIDASGWLKLELNSVWPAGQHGRTSQVGVGFRTDGTEGKEAIGVGFISRPEESASKWDICIFRAVEKRAGFFGLTSTTRTSVMKRVSGLAAPDHGSVQIVYDHGFVQVRTARGKLASAYIGACTVKIESVVLTCEGNDWTISRIGYSSKPPGPLVLASPKILALVDESLSLFRAKRYREVIPKTQQCLELCRQAQGESLYSAAFLDGLGRLSSYIGEYALAKDFRAEECRVLKDLLYEEHPAHADALEKLGNVYSEMAQYMQAEECYVRANRIRRTSLGEDDPWYAVGLTTLGQLCLALGEYSRAEALLVPAMETQDRLVAQLAPGESAPEVVTESRVACLCALGTIDASQGRSISAKPYVEVALGIVKRSFGEKDLRYADLLNTMAVHCERTQELKKAESLLKEARNILKNGGLKDHSLYGVTSCNLGAVYSSMGDYEKAEPLLQESLRIIKGRLGDEHPNYTNALNKLGRLYLCRQQNEKAAQAILEAARCHLRFCERTILLASEARGMFLVRSNLHFRDLVLSALRESAANRAKDAYSLVWQSRCLVTRALAGRFRHLEKFPEAQSVLAELQQTQQKLAALTLASYGSDLWLERRNRLIELNRQKEDLEVKLAGLSTDFRRASAVDGASFPDLLRALPDGVAVIDIVRADIWALNSEKKLVSAPHYEAFVLRKPARGLDPRVVWVHLGPAAPIDQAVWAWRKAITPGNSSESACGAVERGVDSAEPVIAPERRLRAQIWDKLAEHLDGCSTVIIVPDGDLGFVPWVALPGTRPGSYLLEDYGVAVVSHPQQVYGILVEAHKPAGGVLLVGGVNYDASPRPPVVSEKLVAGVRQQRPARTRSPAMKDGRNSNWSPLPGSLSETSAVASLAKDASEVALIKGSEASEDVIRQRMPGSRYVHLATHGFFASSDFHSVFQLPVRKKAPEAPGDRVFVFGRPGLIVDPVEEVEVRNPLVLSGIVLAGANLPPRTNSLGLTTGEDGILTAEEIASLDLRRTELVVLSACDTALGKTAGGEGVLGLQRAFHLAGVHTVIASLWQVDDEAGQQLMRLFYENLWSRRMGKLEALRQAQLTMLRSYDAQLGRLRGPGPVREIDPEQLRQARETAAHGRTRTSPTYWANFMLSGDWR